jgi:uncharacterized GH25 family protein
MSILLDTGFWLLTPDGGWQNLSKKDVKEHVQSGHYIESIKSIFLWSEQSSKPMGSGLEIIPTKNPLLMRPGEILPLKVLFNGEPLAGAVVKSGENQETVNKTAKDGMVDVKVKKGF